MHRYMKITNQQQFGVRILRIGLSIIFLWFGFSQLLDGAGWVYFVPDWVTSVSGISALTVVKMNAVFEIIAGSLLACNLYVRPASLLLALHLALITFEIGISPTGARDLGLTFATFALFFISQPTPLHNTDAEITANS